MMAFLNRAVLAATDLFAFARAVWIDARSLQAETEDRYGPLGF